MNAGKISSLFVPTCYILHLLRILLIVHHHLSSPRSIFLWRAHMFPTLALDFREKIGGEVKIQEYCHRLAREGGKRVAEILGTQLLDPDDRFTASMVSAAPGPYMPSYVNIPLFSKGGYRAPYP